MMKVANCIKYKKVNEVAWLEKKLEDMTIEELLKLHSKLLKELGIKPKKLEINSEGIIVLDPDDEDDRAWYEGF